MELVEKLYVVFLLPPYSASLARSIRKDRRVYFYDCAAASDETSGVRLENLVACALLKWTELKYDSAGERWRLHYLRDKEGREVDFVVTFDHRVHWLIEVKAGDASLSPSLRYYTRKLRPKESLQLVLDLPKRQEREGVKIAPLAEWLERLPGAA